MRAQRRLTHLALVMGSLLAGQAEADGGHIGWCIGVGNKHNAACAGTAGIPVVNGGGTPTTTTSPGTQGTPTLPVASVSVPQPMAQPPLAVQTPSMVPNAVPVAVPPMVPHTVAQPMQVPQQVPTPIPQAIPQQVPQLPAQPMQMPQQVPTATPHAMPHQVPQLVAQPMQVPQQVPTATPQAMPHQGPQLVAQPMQVPQQVPTATPQAMPHQVPQLVAQPMQVPQQVPRPTPVRQPVKVSTMTVDRPTVQSPGGTLSTRPSIVTPLPGRQPAHALPVHRTSADAAQVTCLASGFGWRQLDDGQGDVRRVGLAPVLYTPDMMLHDLPANHPRHAECLIVVDRRFEDR